LKEPLWFKHGYFSGSMLLPWISGVFFIRFNPHAVKAVILTSLVSGFTVFLYVRKLMNIKEPSYV